MIKTFRCEETRRIFNGEASSRLPADIQKTALRKLLMLDAARVLSDLKSPPNNKLEKLDKERKLKGRYAIRINDQWRICFKWEEGALEVEITDYH